MVLQNNYKVKVAVSHKATHDHIKKEVEKERLRLKK